MKILFMGSAPIACVALAKILEKGQDTVVAVVTQPDKPRGRNLEVGACPVSEYATAKGLPIINPAKIGEATGEIESLAPDLIILVAYGQYVPERILNVAPLGAINIHPSLLPLYRGAAPVQAAIANGDTVSGVTILYLSKEMDAGDIIMQREAPVLGTDTSETLMARLADLGAEMLVAVLDNLGRGVVERRPQDGSRATFTKKLVKEDGRIDWRQPAAVLANRVRAYQPWPGCYCRLPDGKILNIKKVQVEDGLGQPGEVLAAKGLGPLVATGTGALRLLEVQPEGKKAMPGAAFLCGARLQPGVILGS